MYRMEPHRSESLSKLSWPVATHNVDRLDDSPEAILLAGIRNIALFEKAFRGRFKDADKEKDFRNSLKDVIIALAAEDDDEMRKAAKTAIGVLKGITKDDLKGGFNPGEEKWIKQALKAFEATQEK